MARPRRDESSIFSHSFSTTWRKALVSLPRMVPDAALRLLSPSGPQPMVIKIPARDKNRSIPLYVFVPKAPMTVTSTSRSISTSKSTPSKPGLKWTSKPARRRLPILLDFHGGGFILGSCQEQAPFCAKLCRELPCVAISVDYSLGPYAQFPAAIYDAEDVLHAVITPSSPAHAVLRSEIDTALTRNLQTPIDLDTTRLAFSGFSSGGSLALNLALSIAADPEQAYLASDWPSPLPTTHTNPVALLLYYPALDTRLLPSERPLPAGMTPPTGFMADLNLESELMPTYLPKSLTRHPRASPALVPKEQGSLHPAARVYLVLPELDSLSESSERWVSKMVEQDRRLTERELLVERAKNMLHGWTQFPDAWIEPDARAQKSYVFDRAVSFVSDTWADKAATGKVVEQVGAGEVVQQS